jgi:hypothetical protein
LPVLLAVAISGTGPSIRLRATMVSLRADFLASCTFVMLPDHFTPYGILPLRPLLRMSSVALPLGRFAVCNFMTAAAFM